MKDYQRARITTFLDPESDPLGYDWDLAVDATFANILAGGAGIGQSRFVQL